MANVDPVQVQINTTSDTSGVTSAQEALNGFQNTLSNVLEIATGFSIANIGTDIAQSFKGAFDQVTQFQTATTAMGVVLSNIGDASTQTANTLGGNAQKISDIAVQIQEATIKYQEKIADLNQKITDTMQGQNVIDAQQNLNQQLEDLAQQHADKIASIQQQITNVQQTETNSLQDMQDAHGVKMADLAEKHAQQMADATNAVQRASLQTKYDEQVQYENDSFQRQYDLRKKQEDRNSEQKIAALKDQITKENEAYDDQVAKDNARADKQIEKFQDDNAKKLALYQRELADEERTYKEHIQKLEQETANATGGGSRGLTQGLEKNNPFSVYSKSAAKNLQDLMGYVNDFSKTSPFNFAEITKTAKVVESMKFNFKELAPIISDLAIGTGSSFSTMWQAMADALNGRPMMLQQMGISEEQLMQLGANYNIATHHLKDQGSLMQAFDNLRTKGKPGELFAGATQKGLHTFTGALSNVQDALFKTAASLLGMDTAAGQVQKGPLSGLTDMMIGISTWLGNNKTGIDNFAASAIKFGSYLLSFFIPVLDHLAQIYKDHKADIDFLAKLLGLTLVAAIIATVWALAEFINMLLTGIDWVLKLTDVIVKFLTPAIDYLKSHWKDMVDFFVFSAQLVEDVVTIMVNGIIAGINNIISGLNGLIGGVKSVANGIPGVKLNIGSIPQMGYASPISIGGSSGGGGSAAGSSVSIYNQNVFNTPTSPNQFSTFMGQQVSLAVGR